MTLAAPINCEKTRRRFERRLARNEAKRQAEQRRADALIERYCARLEWYERLYFYGSCGTEKYRRIREQVLHHIRRLDTHLFTA